MTAIGTSLRVAMTSALPSKVLARVIGDRGRVRSIAFREGELAFQAQVYEDNLWGAVKDNLVLGEYERFGITLADLRGVVVDAGAHVGLFSLLASAHARKVLAFEANPKPFALLSQNVASNGRHNVQPQQRAVWREGGDVHFVEGDQTGSGSILGTHGRRFVVQAETLDSIVAATGPVDLLKLDIEGAEFDVLDNTSDSTLRQISAIVAELHLAGRSERVGPTLDRLRRAGFAVSLRRPPIAYWRETMIALVRNRRRLCGERRLRLAVLLHYGVVPLIRRLSAWRRGQQRDELMFLYAKRTAPKS